MRFAESHLPATTEWHGTKLFARENGKRLITPMFIVILALGTTDLLFALDSIPAIYGLTKEPYLVLTANIFALMGLRQLYFLIGGLLERLVYLSYGLAVLLGFIGVKLVLHAMHENELPFINGGEPIAWAPDIPIWLSLVVIVGTLAVTTVASLAVSRNMTQAEIEERTISLGGVRRTTEPRAEYRGPPPWLSRGEPPTPDPVRPRPRAGPQRPDHRRRASPPRWRWPAPPTSSATAATGWPSTTTCRPSRPPTRRC